MYESKNKSKDEVNAMQKKANKCKKNPKTKYAKRNLTTKFQGNITFVLFFLSKNVKATKLYIFE